MRTLLLLAIVIIAAAGQQHVKPNFSGSWRLNHAKSKLEIDPPMSTTFEVTHNDPAFHITRTHVMKEGSNTWSIDLTTDGKEVVQKWPDGREVHVRLTWQGETLLLDSYFLLPDGVKATNVVTYVLSEDAKTFTADERFNGPKMKYHNLWVFDRR